MFINSQYDPVGIEDTMQIECLKNGKSGKTLQNCTATELKNIENYRNQFLKIVDTLMGEKHSIWTIGCSEHSYACYGGFYNVEAQKVPQLTGSTVAAAV